MVNATVMKDQYYLSKEAIKSYYEEYLVDNRDEWDIFVLINRKGYWDYKIFFPDLHLNKMNQRIVVSDRLLEKYPIDDLRKLLTDKRVIVYDDSLTNGSNLFFYYLLCKAYGAKEVNPVVYALNSEFPTNRSIRLMEREASRIDVDHLIRIPLEQLINEFVDKLTCKVILGNKDIDKMSIWQTMLFQECVSPLVMDLPMMNHRKNAYEKKISLSKEQFEKLCKNQNERWKFVENEMRGWGDSVKASYFRFNNQLLNSKFPGLFHDFVVKCKYNQRETNIDIVFTPFAIVKSITYENSFRCFKVFYENTVYGKSILKRFPEGEYSASVMEKDHNLCRAIFRAIIYRLSDYIGRNFQKHVKELLGIDLEYDWDIMEDNFDSSFIETQKSLYIEYDDNKLRNLIYQYRQEMQIPHLKKKINLKKDKILGTQSRINNYIRKRTSEKKKGIYISLDERVYTFETIETEIDERFFFENAEDRREKITNVCLLFLETNSFSNLIYPNNNDHIIYRGFRYGENSEIFLHENLWLFYSYLYAYYYEYGSKNIKENYDSFMNRVERYMRKQGYFEIWFSEDDFLFLKDYFGKMDREELIEEIQRREYLLDFHLDGKEDILKKNLISEAADIVKLWGEV